MTRCTGGKTTRASANTRVCCRRVQALAHILTLAVYVSRQGAEGKGLVLHAARALRKVAAVSCSAPSAGGPKSSRAGQAAAAGSRVLLLVSVCQVVRVSSPRCCVRGRGFVLFLFPVCQVVSRCPPAPLPRWMHGSRQKALMTRMTHGSNDSVCRRHARQSPLLPRGCKTRVAGTALEVARRG